MTRVRAPRPVHAAPLRLRETERLGEAFGATLHACCRQVLANIEGARLGRDAESLHQLRVGLRRLRAAMAVYRAAIPAALQRDWTTKLRELEHEVGAARDWDVLMGEIARAAADGGKPEELERLLPEARVRQAESHRQARRLLGRPEILRLISEIDHHADHQGRALPGAAGKAARPLKPFAREFLSSRHHKVRQAGRAIHKLEAPELHELRIRIKKLRYAVEFFAGLWPKAATAPYLAALRGLQDELGLIQDAASGSALLQAMVSGKRDCPKPSLRRMSLWIEKSRARAHRRLARHWQAFATAKRFWKNDPAQGGRIRLSSAEPPSPAGDSRPPPPRWARSP